ncbi:MAG: CDP-diacylglycerol--serine O-phosphatidyltransferase [Bacteroidales bacterium]
MVARKQIPNIITLLNLFCGIESILHLLYFQNMVMSALFIVLGAVFDFLDGMVARLLKVSSPMGKELDSLSDVVTFGVSPSLIVVYILMENGYNKFWLLPAIVMALMSAYRLAKFNLDNRQTDSFIGLATPANAFVWLSIPLVGYLGEKQVPLWFLSDNGEFFQSYYKILSSPYFIIPILMFCCLLLVAELPMFSLKFHNLSWIDNKVRFVFIISSLLLLLLFYFGAIPMIIILYIILSVINNVIKNRK